MADHINVCRQRAIEGKQQLNALLNDQLVAKKAWNKLLDKQAAGTLSTSEKDELPKAQAKYEAYDDRIKEQRGVLLKAEQDLDAEQRRLDMEDAQLAIRPSGRIPGTPHQAGDGEGAAALMLPPLPAGARAAVSRLYPQASADPEQRAEQWRGVVAAALGGAPMHPAVLAALATEGAPEGGGFAVTMEVAAGLFMRGVEESVFARIGARIEPMTAEEKVVNAVDDDDESSDAEGGLTAAWLAEGADAGDPQLLRIRQVKLTARKLVVLAAASNELAEDAPDYIAALEAAMGRAIGKRLDRAVLTGTGAGQPLGLLNAPATITVSKEGGQPAATFKWENATKMWARLAPGSHERAWWLIHPTVLPEALSMHLVIGTAGTQPAAVFTQGGPTGYMLLGRPVLVTGRTKVLGTKGDVILVDPTQIAIGIRRGIVIDRSAHAYFSSDKLAIRGRFRGDARPFWEKARTLPEGSDTVSPVVVLETRS